MDRDQPRPLEEEGPARPGDVREDEIEGRVHAVGDVRTREPAHDEVVGTRRRELDPALEQVSAKRRLPPLGVFHHLVDGAQACQRIGEVRAQCGEHVADAVAAEAPRFTRPRVDGHPHDQRLRGQLAAFVEILPQGPAADGEHDVVECHARHAVAHRLQIGQRQRRGREHALGAQSMVERGDRVLEGPRRVDRMPADVAQHRGQAGERARDEPRQIEQAPHAHAQRMRDQARSARHGLGLPRLRRRGRRLDAPILAHHVEQQFERSDAIGDAVVDLGDEADVAAREAFDRGDLPQRLVAGQRPARDLRDDAAQRRGVPRRVGDAARQVPAEVEVRVLDPDRVSEPEGISTTRLRKAGNRCRCAARASRKTSKE